MKRFLIPLLAALVLPTAVNAKKNYKTLFRGEYDGYNDIVVEKIYDEWRDTTSCKIEFSVRSSSTIDPSNYQLHVAGNLHDYAVGYKFDKGWINKFNYEKDQKYKISIPYSKWSKHKILLINEGTITTNWGGLGEPNWNTTTFFRRIDLKVINRARKHHQACLKGGPSWLY